MTEGEAQIRRINADRARTVVGTFVLHLRPVRVPEGAIRFTHTFGLGGMSLVLLLLLAATGSLLMLVYRPAPGEAYASIETLEDSVLFGAFVRALHRWSGNALVVISVLHILRVFVTGGHREGRELIFFLAGFHFWRVRKAAGVVLPPDSPREENGAPSRVPFLPELLMRETAAGLALAPAGRGAEAERALERALELDPSSAELLCAPGDFQLRRGRFGEAEACADRILGASPDDPGARALKALAASRALPPD